MKTNLSTFSGSSAARLEESTLPTVLNNHSDGTDVAIIHKLHN